jgi:hypothetical protein
MIDLIQIFVVLFWVLFFAVVSGFISFWRTYWLITGRLQNEAAPVITRRLRIRNTQRAIVFFLLVLAILAVDLLSPGFHDRVHDLQDRIEDIFHSATPGSEVLVSIVFWLSIYVGTMVGRIPGQWFACRKVGEQMMKATINIKAGDLIGSPWL